MKLAGTIFTTLWLCAVVYFGRGVAFVAKPRLGTGAPVVQVGSTHRLAESMQRKLDRIHNNAQLAHPDPTPTVLTEDEVNDYLMSGKVELPQGVKKVKLQGRSGVVDGFVTVDFDEISAGQRSSNPLLSIFSGVHNVNVEGDASGSGRQGKVHIRNVAIDGFDVPRVALEYFVQKYITPKYPNVGLDSQFPLPDKIDTATVDYHKLTVTQR